MEKNKKNLALILAAGFFVLGFVGLVTAATTVNLGTATNFAILASSTVTNTGPSVVNGDLGLSPGSSVTAFPPGTLNGTQYINNTAAAQAQSDLTVAYNDAAGQPCTQNLTGQDLGGMALTPGVYCFDTSAQLTGILTLNAQSNYDSVFIFKIGSTLTTASGSSVVFTNNTQACNVFWQVGSSATLGTNTSFRGSILALTSVTLNNGATLEGRALARTGAVTLDTNIITRPSCTATPVSSTRREGTLNVVKLVVNDNGGTKTINDFPLFVNGTAVVSGVTNTFRAPADAYTITETVDPHYTQTFSGDCDVNGQLNLSPGDNKFCVITNNDIGAPAVVLLAPPLIDVVKVPTPLALPAGPGLVNYAYTLRNIGTVPVNNITMVGDTCSPIVLTSGDVNSDAKLDLNEAWVYHCSTTLSVTHTNTVTATGWANALSAVDVASSTVVVGLPIVPPLIHVTKVPSTLTLIAGGGIITYTERITNPGTVAISNVRLVDDKCSPVSYISGDANNDSKLDTNETWIYTCKTKLTKTTTNTAIASGEANGLTSRDVAVATVVVAVPGLPQTGTTTSVWTIVFLIAIFVLASVSFMVIARKRKI
jgi:LPXTG-motif cell wall-anchored protein/uncharacterized repeat protein (TIGR01451 family)